MARIGFGGDLAGPHGDDQPDQRLVAARLGRDDARRGGGLRASNNQACIITPFILAGAMAPVTTAGVAAQMLAEALAGMTFTQLIRPGAPVIFGCFASRCRCRPGRRRSAPPSRRC